MTQVSSYVSGLFQNFFFFLSFTDPPLIFSLEVEPKNAKAFSFKFCETILYLSGEENQLTTHFYHIDMTNSSGSP